MSATSGLLSALREGSKLFITYGGTETQLIYEAGVELPDFCAFDAVMKEPETLASIHGSFVALAARKKCGIICDAATWRAQRPYVEKLGYDLREVLTKCVEEQRSLVREVEVDALISAEIGPRGDGYVVEDAMTPEEAETYHETQVAILKACGVDCASALTMTYASEAIGIARAANKVGLPLIVGCTLETDGRLPDGSTLADFVAAVDAATDASPLCFLVNCCHPTHCADVFARAAREPWFNRLRGIRANASDKSHEELDKMTELDAGDPGAFGKSLADFHNTFGFTLLGGCCGSNLEHITAILDHIQP